MEDKNLELTNRMLELNIRIDRLEELMLTEDYKRQRFEILKNIRTTKDDLEIEIYDLNQKINRLLKLIKNK